MTTAFKSMDKLIVNPMLKPLYAPFRSVAVNNLLAAWRFGNGLTDLSGNGKTLTAVGAPTIGAYYISGDKANGYLTNVADGLERTIIAIYRHTLAQDSYIYPVGNLSQLSGASGIGFGIKANSSSPSALSRRSILVGSTSKSAALYGVADGTAEPLTNRSLFAWQAAGVSGAGNSAYNFIPTISTGLIAATLAAGANLAARDVTESAAPSYYRLAVWRDNSTPATTYSNVDIAEILVFDRLLTLAELQAQYAYDKAYMSVLGVSI